MRELINKYNIRPTKSLGQNFLNDQNIVEHIVDAAEVGINDIVIEVGPGIGSMTTELAARAGKVIAVEIDKHLIPVLSENLKEFTNVSIINEDVLDIDFKRLLSNEANGFDKIKVVANLPYYITTPIIMKFLEDNFGIDLMVFMVQKEVADRMGAKPGKKDYGALSVAVQYYSNPTKMFNVPPHCFIPQPGVDSSVIKLDIFDKPPVELENTEFFFKTVKAAFGQRRKTLLNALSNSGCFNQTKEEIREILNSKGIEENQRGETLSIMQFAELSNAFYLKSC